MSDDGLTTQDYLRMQQAILLRAYRRGEPALLALGEPINVDAELALLAPEEAAAIRTGEAPLPSPADQAAISRILESDRRKSRREREGRAATSHPDTQHEQVQIQHGKLAAEVDVGIAPLILELWKARLVTVKSCEAHAGSGGKVWVEFLTPHQVDEFLSIVAPLELAFDSIHYRVQSWRFGMYQADARSLNYAIESLEDRESKAWEFHLTIRYGSLDACGKPDYCTPALSLGVSVLFPQQDLDLVVTRLRDYREEWYPEQAKPDNSD